MHDVQDVAEISEQHKVKKKILVVDDEPRLVDAIEMNLSLEGYEVIAAYTGSEALKKVEEENPDLVTLDIQMPEMDGFETLRRIRAVSDVPVIMVTVMGKDFDKVKGLVLGADDYVSKPFRQQELLARIGAVIRRVENTDTPSELVQVDNDISIDFGRSTIVVRGTEVRLRPTENRLLYRLVTDAGHVLSQESLLKTVWGPEYKGQDQYVWLYITHLRQKIEEDPESPKYILGWRGIGYYFKASKSNGRRIRSKISDEVECDIDSQPVRTKKRPPV